MALATLLSLFLVLFLLSDPSQCKKNECDTCTSLVESMKKGMDRTRTSNFGGGNSEWEETRLGSYATSEMRLVEILDSLCGSTDHDCNSMLEEHEEVIEEWWFKRQETDSDMKVWLCENTLEVCCPPNTFGSTCEECPGGKDTPCSGKGECLGAGKRDGSGKCSCNDGYEGQTCETCAEGYYRDEDDNCLNCDVSCSVTCHGPGPQGCDSCKHGYNQTENGCEDVNECVNDTLPCEGGQYCLNNEGSFDCLACDSVCVDNCTGPGPTGCLACVEGYLMSEEMPGCQDVDECMKNSSLCEMGRYCKNTVGSYECEFCDVSCGSDCTEEGPDQCVDCANGYDMQDDICQDVDECSLDSHTCNLDIEECINAMGSFECECKEGYTRADDKECIPTLQEDTDTDTENFDDDPASKDVNSSVEPSESEIGETLPDTEAPNSQDEIHSKNHEEL